MKFGILDVGHWHESETSEEVYRAVVDHAQLAEELGFEAIWLGEHHFSRHGIYGNTLTLASHIAGKTDRLRIGTAVVILPLHHPLRVAEEAAMVDVLSGGRLDLGVGAGYQWREFNGLGVDIKESRERFIESLEILTTAWSSDALSFQGKFRSWDAEDELIIHPKPRQSPDLPVYVAVSASPRSLELAASHNLRILVGGPTDIMGIAPQVIERWRQAMTNHGNDPSGKVLPCAKGIYVAETDEQAAADIAAIDQLWDVKLLSQIGSPLSPAGEVPPGYESWAMRVKDREKRVTDNTTGTAALVGSPETVAHRIKELEEMGLEYIFGSFGLPGMPEEKKRRSIELFGREIIPQFS
ncbi:LLM class flavin-dependent oxidoreductase [Pseudonocardia ailaonensis]|uniref:LLM class flavin-dependent oxidoreductase n=1 Tax=Pseudonocardia ailaonensis TaxID=367279 RepID=A0ABN2NAB3_9PSEU